MFEYQHNHLYVFQASLYIFSLIKKATLCSCVCVYELMNIPFAAVILIRYFFILGHFYLVVVMGHNNSCEPPAVKYIYLALRASQIFLLAQRDSKRPKIHTMCYFCIHFDRILLWWTCNHNITLTIYSAHGFTNTEHNPHCCYDDTIRV